MDCSIPGCGKPAKARGWCTAHYERWRKHGDPNVVLVKESKLRSDRPPWPIGGACIEWPGFTNSNGYGLINHELVHREVFIALTGTEPEVVRHTCDNPPCYRFEHLVGGTHVENVRDRVERGRSATGSRNKGGRRFVLGEHGTMKRYRQRCRCGDCRAANAEWARKYAQV